MILRVACYPQPNYASAYSQPAFPPIDLFLSMRSADASDAPQNYPTPLALQMVPSMVGVKQISLR